MKTDWVEHSKMNRMLIVEDDESQRVTLADIMVDQGFEVDSCGTGAGALEKLGEAHYGVVIVDLQLPDLSGTHILDELERLERSSCVIIYTAYASLETAKDSINKGAFGYIEKGKDPAVLVEQVHRALREYVGRCAAELESAVEERTRSLRESEERYQDLYENAPEMFLSFEPDGGRILNCNTTLVRKLGRGKEEIIGDDLLDLFAPNCHQVIRSALEVFGETGEIDNLELRLACADGSELHVVVSATAVRDDSGRILRSRSVLHDVTQRKRDEQRLRELQLAVESSGTGIARLDSSGSFVDVHEIYARLIGYDPDELVGMTWESTVHPDDRDKVTRAFQRMAADGQAEERVRGIRKDGSEFVKRLNLVLACDEWGEPVGHYCLMRDITESFRSEERLLHSQKIEALGRVAGGVAHDFNNLLTVIRGYSDLMYRSLDPEDPHREDLSQIRQACQRASGLTRHLLAFCRKQVLKLETVDLHSLVDEMVALVCPLVGESYGFDIDLRADESHVAVDSDQLSQVFVNLAVNARDAMPRGGLIRIETSNRTVTSQDPIADLAPGSYLELTFADSGVGMDVETASHAFEPFFTTKPPGQGSGLGLSSAYGILRQFGGDISVSSEAGKGSSFRVLLPVAISGDSRSVESGDKVPVEFGRTVLVVEDDESVRKIVAGVLEENGYRVLSAEHGEAALRTSERYDGRIDALITDVVMPGLSGLELASEIQRSRPDVRVLFVSGYPHDAHPDLQTCAESVNFLPKPFEVRNLLRALAAAFDSAIAEDSA